MKKIFSLCCLAILGFVVAPRVSFASTVNLTLESSSGSPYVFSINGSSKYTDLSCLNDQRTVSNGESWQATATTLSTLIASAKISDPSNPGSVVVDGTMTIKELEEDAYLDSLYGSNTTVNQEIQDAIWTILDRATGTISSTSYDYFSLPGSGMTLTNEETAVSNDYAAALASLTNSKYDTSAFYSEFTFYEPVTGSQSCNGIPQEFLGYKAITPEPSSLILLGTGIAGLAGGLRRRKKAAKQA